MPSTSVTRTEYRRYIRGKTPWIIGVCVLLFSRIAVQPGSPELQVLGGAAPLVTAQVATTIVVPFAAAVLGFRAVTQERESGTARIILGTKTTRPQFVLSIVLGRGTALLAPVVAGTLLVTAYDAFQYSQFSPLLLLGFLALVAIYVYAWMGLIVGLSAASSSTTRAVILGTIVTLALALWNDVTLAVLWQLITGTTPGPQIDHQAAFQIAGWLSPLSAFQVLTNWLLGVPVGPGNAVAQISDALTETGELATTSPPLSAWWGFGFLLSWPMLSLLGGITIFQRSDLAARSQLKILRTLQRVSPSLPRVESRLFARLTGNGGLIDALPGSWQPLARREFQRLIRTPLVWGVGMLVFVAGILSLSPAMYVQDALGSRMPLAALQRPLTFIGGIGVLFGTFRSVNHERDTGAIRFTAGTAISRMGTLIGFTLGRAGAFAVPIVGGIVLTCLLAVPQHGIVPLGILAGFLVFAVFFVTVIAGIGVSISTVFQSQAIAGFTILVFVGVQIAWFTVSNTLYSLITGVSANGLNPPSDPLYLFFRWIPPLRLPNVVTNAIIDVPNSAAPASSVIRELQPNQFSNIVVARLAYGTDIPVWFLHPTVALGQLLLWLILPLGVALWVYRTKNID